MVYKDAPTSEIHSFETLCLSQLLVESESSCFTIPPGVNLASILVVQTTLRNVSGNDNMYQKLPWRRGLVASSPPASEKTGAMGRVIESRQGTYA
jgi:hypothetical protein